VQVPRRLAGGDQDVQPQQIKPPRRAISEGSACYNQPASWWPRSG
jgi:hypothetical protein